MTDPMIAASAEALWPHLPGGVQDGYELDDTHRWVDRGPTFPMPPSVISELVRERAFIVPLDQRE